MFVGSWSNYCFEFDVLKKRAAYSCSNKNSRACCVCADMSHMSWYVSTQIPLVLLIIAYCARQVILCGVCLCFIQDRSPILLTEFVLGHARQVSLYGHIILLCARQVLFCVEMLLCFGHPAGQCQCKFCIQGRKSCMLM